MDLHEVAEVRFTVAVEGGTRRAWTWAPATNTASTAGATVHLGAAHTDAERATERAFYEDSFWLSPLIHVGWAGAAAIDHGSWVELRYTPGDTHDLYLDAQGRVVRWVFHPGGGPATQSARFEDYARLGPLWVARTRILADRKITVEDLDWTPTGTAFSVDAAGQGAFGWIGPDRCRFGSLTLARKADPVLRPVSPGAGTFDRTWVVRTGEGRADRRWSPSALAFADPGWLAGTGVFGCDWWAADPGQLRPALAAMDADERAALLALWLAWVDAAVERGPMATLAWPQVRADASKCAATGECAALLAWAGVLRR